MGALSSEDVEMSIIGCVLEDPTKALRVSTLPEDAFASGGCQVAHRAIQRMVGRNETVDLISLIEEMKVELEQPEAYVMSCQTKGFLISAFGNYEAKLLEYRRRRIIANAATKALTDIKSPAVEIDNVCDGLDKAIHDLGGETGSISMYSAVEAFVDSLGEAHKGRCYTGIADLDRLTGGFRGGKLVVLGARPGVGKTALALYIAANVADKTGPVLISSLEMDEVELVTRFMASRSGVDAEHIETGNMTPEDHEKLVPWIGEMSNARMKINTSATTPLQLRRAATEMKQNGGLAMIVVDYIQLMRTDSSKKSRYEEVSEISRELKLLAQDLRVPILALSQFNRASEQGVNGKASNRMPTMAEAKDSGSIEQDANLFLIQWAPGEPKDNQQAQEVYNYCQMYGMEYQVLNVAKNRQGRTGLIHMAFDKPHMRFKCIARR